VDTIVFVSIAGLLAVVLAYVVWRAWPEPANPPWGMGEFYRRMGDEPPRRSEKLDQETSDRLT
jgi:hypothetical protein